MEFDPGIVSAVVGEPSLGGHPRARELAEILAGETALSSAGFPYIGQRGFELLRDQVPHLFTDGGELLRWLAQASAWLEQEHALPPDASQSVARAIRVVRNVVNTAAVTAPPDLWLLRQVISTHLELGTLQGLLDGASETLEEIAARGNWQLAQLACDLRLMSGRGYLQFEDGRFRLANGEAGAVLKSLLPLGEAAEIDWVAECRAWFGEESFDTERTDRLRQSLHHACVRRPTGSWIADAFEIETGYRLLPLVLGLRLRLSIEHCHAGQGLDAPRLLPEMTRVLTDAGVIDEGRLTELGARMLTRGPGPYGIIASYFPYLKQHAALLEAGGAGVWVRRTANVSASQDANRKTFTAANDALDEFCERHRWHYSVFIEHAVGRGEATRQRFARPGGSGLHYVGADLEEAAIAAARQERDRGSLPANMRFLAAADIGRPDKLLSYLDRIGLDPDGAVMMVGNGFHEVREQSNAAMVAVLRAYQEAGILLIFTEESALSDAQLLETAWNTYHAGFRYVHELSGQGLRPAWEGDAPDPRYSWSKCARLAGYRRLDAFSRRTRTIFPFARPRRNNPSISVTHFCVPQALAERLGLRDESAAGRDVG